MLIAISIIVLIIVFGAAIMEQISKNSQKREIERMEQEQRNLDNTFENELVPCFNYLRENYKILTSQNLRFDYIKLYSNAISGTGKIDPSLFYIFRNKTHLCFVEQVNHLEQEAEESFMIFGRSIDSLKQCYQKYKLKTLYIPLDNIEYFMKEGSKFATTEISGGGGGGTIGGNSLSGGLIGGAAGTLVGGAFGAGVGAVIGSRKESNVTIDPIKSTTKIHNEMECYLKYKKDDGALAELQACSDKAEEFFNVLKSLIPEKEYSYILSHQNIQQNIQKNNINNNTAEDRIKQLNVLRDKGLIQQEQYDKKLQEIINSI